MGGGGGVGGGHIIIKKVGYELGPTIAELAHDCVQGRVVTLRVLTLRKQQQ